MVKPCPALRVLSVLVVLSMTMTVPCAFDADAAGEEPGIDGSQPPATGDWFINQDTDVRGQDITINGNITVQSRVNLHVHRSNLTVNGGSDWPSRFYVSTASSLEMDNSSIHVDCIEAHGQAGVRLDRTEVHARSRVQLDCFLLIAQSSTIQCVAPNVQSGDAGKEADLNLSVHEGSVGENTTIFCKGGSAGVTGPNDNGSDGGAARAVIGVPIISRCDIRVIAGEAASGGLGLAGTDGGSGGRGGNASLSIVTGRMEDSTIVVTGSVGGNGARGSDIVDGSAGEGGDGAPGGDARVGISSIPNPDLDDCELDNCTVKVYAGSGGSGGNGGSSSHGDGGFGGYAGPGGSASISVASSGDVLFSKVEVSSIGGDGGYGGDYGRRSDGSRSNGGPRPGGRGGDADISVAGDHDCILRNVSLTSEAGSGYDGGSGYDQGEVGGDGGDSVLSIRMGEGIDAEDTDFMSRAGNGGNGGPAYSNIFGNGGNGGNSTLEIVGNLSIEMRRFKLLMEHGAGGRGNTPIWNGKDGIDKFDLRTQTLEMWDGELNQPLDDLTGDAKGYLYNCSFKFSGLPALPQENAEVWTYYPVDIWVVDGDKHQSLTDHEVRIISVSTGMVIAIRMTDERGRVSVYPGAFYYTSREVLYVGGYIVSVTSADGRGVTEMRLDCQDAILWPYPYIISVTNPPHWVHVTIDRPLDGEHIHLSREARLLEVVGNITVATVHDNITSVFIELYPYGSANYSGYRLVLPVSPVALSDVTGEDGRWGWSFRPENASDEWNFFARFDLFAPGIHSTNDDYVVTAHASDGFAWGSENRSIRLTIIRDSDPTVTVTTDVRTIDWNVSEPILLEGTAWDDIGVVAVEMRIDMGAWVPVDGTTTWSTHLDVSKLPEGFHTIALRASDGSHYSPEATITMSIDRPEDDGEGPDGGPLASAPTWLWLVLIIVVAALVAGALVWRRQRRGQT